MASTAVRAKRSFSTMSQSGLDSNDHSPPEPLSKLQEMSMPASMYPRQRHSTHADESSTISKLSHDTRLTEK
jgi:hypothetical protein